MANSNVAHMMEGACKCGVKSAMFKNLPPTSPPPPPPPSPDYMCGRFTLFGIIHTHTFKRIHMQPNSDIVVGAVDVNGDFFIEDR